MTHVVLVGDVAHLAGVGQRQRERLFAQHVFAGARGGDGDFAVDVIRRGDDHRVDRVGRDHLVGGAEAVGDPAGDLRLFQHARVGVAQRDDFRLRQQRESRQMVGERHLAGADQAHADGRIRLGHRVGRDGIDRK